MRKLFLSLCVTLCSCILVDAQQDPQFTMYMFNRQVLNPAYAGANQVTNITALGRQQWVGIPGGPQTATLSMNGYVRAIHGGVGGYLMADKLGPLSTIGAKVAYAFQMNLGSTATSPILNIGVQGGIFQKTLNGNWKYDQDPGIDPVLPPNGQSIMVPDIDAGIYFRKPMKGLTTNAEPVDKFYIGGAVTHILEPSIDGLLLTSIGPQSTLQRGISGSAGYTITLSKNIYLQPSAFFRMVGPLMQFDITTNLYVSPMVFGIAHRWKDSFSGIIGFNATSNLFMGYSYDYTISNLRGFTTGSHEVIVSYNFPSKRKLDVGIKGVSRNPTPGRQ